MQLPVNNTNERTGETKITSALVTPRINHDIFHDARITSEESIVRAASAASW